LPDTNRAFAVIRDKGKNAPGWDLTHVFTGFLGERIVTQEFYISVTPLREDEYLVRTEWGPEGVPLAEEFVRWPLDEWLNQAAQLMHDPIVGLLRGSRTGAPMPIGTAPAADLVALGQSLYDALFQGTIRDSWMISQGVAQHLKQVLRLRLGLKGDRLPCLPWEVLHDGAKPLATRADIVFSRYHSVSPALPRSASGVIRPADQPLRLLMVLAAPTDQEVLELHQEAVQLQAELQRDPPSNGQPALELTILDQPGREQLTQALEQGRYDVLHYAGHSNLGASGGDLYLVSARTGLTEVLSGDDLAGLLMNNGVRMAVFNSCRGVYASTAVGSSDASGNLADALIKRGIPAVLAMAERIPDEVALNLSRLFYRNLKQRSPIDLSLNRARQGLLSSYGSDQLYWALPILYLHPEFDGNLQPMPEPPMGGGQSQAFLDPLDPGLMELSGFDPADIFDATEYPDDGEYQSDRSAILDLFNELSSAQRPAEASFTQPSSAGVAAAQEATKTRLQQDVEDFNNLGLKLHAEGDLTGAIAAYGDALKLQPQAATVYHNLGRALQQYGSLPEALTAYKMAVQLDPLLSDAQANLQSLVNPSDVPATESPASNPAQAANFGDPRRPADRLRSWKTPATLAATAAALGALWFSAGQLNQPVAPGTAPTTLASAANSSNRQELVNMGIKSFNAGDWRQGIEATQQLINQGDLIQAEAAIANLPPTGLDIPAVNFLRGRLSWEKGRRSKDPLTLIDARRSFREAVKQQPQDAAYQNTLGFAFYEVGETGPALAAWGRAAELVAKEKKEAAVADRELQTANAGQALAMYKLASQPSSTAPSQSQKMQGKALKLRDGVTQANVEAFSTEGVRKDWRWGNNAIGDWGKLLAVKEK
jgi:tetratricopeptide (TPR) repeat protein